MNRTPNMNVGVIGLGLLGSALAERLIQGGYDVFVFNRTREKADKLIQLGAQWIDNPFEKCDRVVVCLYTTATVRSVLDAMRSAFREGQIVVDTTTGSPTESPALGQSLAEQGIQYLEAPIAASSEQTRQGKALTMVGGPETSFAACRDILQCIAPQTYHVGDWGDAAKTKLVNNLILGLTRAALAEGLVFAKSIGLSPSACLEVLKAGNAYSVVMDVKGDKMLNSDFSTQAKLAQHGKDVRLMIAEAKKASIDLPMTERHLELLDHAVTAGLGEVDNSAIIQAIANWKRV